jgi:hypothetical protein
MLDNARAFARKPQEAGNEHAALLVRDGTPHGFCLFPRLFREGEAYAAVENFLHGHLAVQA